MLAAIMTSAATRAVRLSTGSRVTLALVRHGKILRRYPLAGLIVAVTCVRVLDVGVRLHQIPHAIGYLAAVWLGAFLTAVIVGETSRPRVYLPGLAELSRLITTHRCDRE